ncbi:MAG TPA: phosphonate metabolism protein/1,5-bisphosphokinase (PRPP-forming) PhnN [Ramlibacter sp.]|uniref:phosphonate metabolism protein/1,5-bisphosphokinase (PRPP-forming) PhnN n=1 Tax=Ramlibacter sp. TaxID=1917967 RepID=UPI002ED0ED02
MKGWWVMVCGPSGAGKDSVLGWAQRELASHPAICFARRLVTRPSEPGSEHEPVDPATLEALRRQGGLAWNWDAHGLRYGIRSEYARRVAAGEIVVVNGSREHARSVAHRSDLRCVLLTASPDVLHSRLHTRAREDAKSISLRLARNAGLSAPFAHRVIANDSALENAGAALRDYLVELAR